MGILDFMKALKTKKLKDGTVIQYLKIPKKHHVTKHGIDFLWKHICLYKELQEKHPDRDYQEHIVELYGMYLEDKIIYLNKWYRFKKYELNKEEIEWAYKYVLYWDKRIKDLENSVGRFAEGQPPDEIERRLAHDKKVRADFISICFRNEFKEAV